MLILKDSKPKPMPGKGTFNNPYQSAGKTADFVLTILLQILDGETIYFVSSSTMFKLTRHSVFLKSDQAGKYEITMEESSGYPRHPNTDDTFVRVKSVVVGYANLANYEVCD